ncbi:hypothetical protein GQ607_002554 [Colletotrichum asianum]|uniref:Uncharacterized protein n=1 Tax=Colletotrichum asianum TaxID=702518 RepID=A0A8H3WMS0_9PEZI|nr:hypothetical protein GQ607_002554 [Colletotrichum asianum]
MASLSRDPVRPKAKHTNRQGPFQQPNQLVGKGSPINQDATSRFHGLGCGRQIDQRTNREQKPGGWRGGQTLDNTSAARRPGPRSLTNDAFIEPFA